jgi:hypothetical protein
VLSYFILFSGNLRWDPLAGCILHAYCHQLVEWQVCGTMYTNDKAILFYFRKIFATPSDTREEFSLIPNPMLPPASTFLGSPFLGEEELRNLVSEDGVDGE